MAIQLEKDTVLTERVKSSISLGTVKTRGTVRQLRESQDGPK